ncbi:aminoglycoside adenylyltransferase domain-containing protein [Nocardioides flavus (ex Wang et al. 2016)]|uniref:aminoglycoside adenylyltransferase domain-containing protein n=1 Tax=Nocardioides flavus (ex Wang et al. 2016) TaxID=2058780 RepID=UPI001E57CC19|nr:aminoglycoside adenylyltransferase domain-containing protein [Nocardioides flavus (ex Wang et al. 2016)]
MLNPHPTRYADLNGVLHDLVTGAQSALGGSFVGAYLQGSFALGAGDRHSDCDFLVVVRERPDAGQEAALRALHRELPHRDGFWHRHLEGSYAVAADLRSTAGLGRPWLHVDHGSDEMEWSEHCNQPWTRWIVREHGITLVGPCPAQLMDPVPDEVLRERARTTLATLSEEVEAWCPPTVAWCQRYLVVQACRSLYTVRTGRVASKRDALRWVMVHGDPGWRPLLQQVLADRDRGLDPLDAPPPGAMEAAREFAAYAAAVA